jgi:hypothetical protein
MKPGDIITCRFRSWTTPTNEEYYISVEKDAGDFKIGVFTIIAIGPGVKASRRSVSTLESGGILVFLEDIIDEVKNCEKTQ